MLQQSGGEEGFAGVRLGARVGEIESRYPAWPEYSCRNNAQVLHSWQAAGGASLWRWCLGFCNGGRLISEAALEGGQFGFPVSDGQDAVVADFVKTGRQAVLQEATDEFRRIERHGFLLTVLPVILVGKRYFAILYRQYSPVADSNTMGIAPQVVDHLFGAAKRPLGIHHPLAFVQPGEQDNRRYRFLV